MRLLHSVPRFFFYQPQENKALGCRIWATWGKCREHFQPQSGCGGCASNGEFITKQNHVKSPGECNFQHQPDTMLLKKMHPKSTTTTSVGTMKLPLKSHPQNGARGATLPTNPYKFISHSLSPASPRLRASAVKTSTAPHSIRLRLA